MLFKNKKRKMPWLEVETKIKIRDVKEIRKKVKKMAGLVKKETRGDDYFAIKRKGYPKKAFRIRFDGKQHIVNFKKWLRNYWSKDIVVKQEFEFKLGDVEHLDNFLALLQDLGFEEWIKKTKYSESYHYKKDKRLVIEINRIKHLGYFLEIEYLCKKKEMKKAKKKIRQVLRELEIKQEDIDNTGYTKMLWDKGIKDKRLFLK
jgi:adenylate cyclase class 2